MTTAEAAKVLRVSPSTVRRWLADERIEGQRIGKRWLIPQPGSNELSIREAARLLRAHPETVRRWLVEGRIPGRRVGRQWRVQRNQLIALVEGRDRLAS